MIWLLNTEYDTTADSRADTAGSGEKAGDLDLGVEHDDGHGQGWSLANVNCQVTSS